MYTLTDGSRYAYHVSHEAYYAKTCGYLDKPEVMVTRHFPDDVCIWEFSVRQVSDIGIKVGVFDDGWAAFREIPEFFQSLAVSKPRTIADVIEILRLLGFEDVTKRVSPYPEREPSTPTEVEVLRGLVAEATASELAPSARERIRRLAGIEDDR